MAIFFGVVVLILVVVFGVASVMQSYASAQQAQAVVETAQVAQMATFANVVVIVVMALVLVLILAGIVYLVIKLNRRPRVQPDRRQNRLEAGRQYGRQLKQLQAENEPTQLRLGDPSASDSLLVADDEQVDKYLDMLFQDWLR
jgi:uncharacterized protein HemY